MSLASSYTFLVSQVFMASFITVNLRFKRYKTGLERVWANWAVLCG